MKKLNGNARNGTVDAFLSAILASYEESGVEDENLKKIFALIKSLQSGLSSAIKQERTASGLDEEDAVRDEKFRALIKLLDGLTAIPVAEVSEAAKELFAIVSRYGAETTLKSYDEESSDIASLKSDLSKAELEEKIKALPGLSVLLSELWEAEDAFLKARKEAVKQKVSLPLSATSLKKQSLAFVNSCLLPYIESVCYVREDLKGLSKIIAENVERANAAAK